MIPYKWQYSIITLVSVPLLLFTALFTYWKMIDRFPGPTEIPLSVFGVNIYSISLHCFVCGGVILSWMFCWGDAFFKMCNFQQSVFRPQLYLIHTGHNCTVTCHQQPRPLTHGVSSECFRHGKLWNDIFKCIFENENEWISPKISLTFVPKATSHYLKQWWLVYWRIYASLGLNELMAPTTQLLLWQFDSFILQYIFNF